MSHDLPADWYVEHDGQRLVLDSAKVAAEIERLRAALRQIAGKNDLEGVPQEDCPSAAYAALHDCEIIAREALELVPQQSPTTEK